MCEILHCVCCVCACGGGGGCGDGVLGGGIRPDAGWEGREDTETTGGSCFGVGGKHWRAVGAASLKVSVLVPLPVRLIIIMKCGGLDGSKLTVQLHPVPVSSFSPSVAAPWQLRTPLGAGAGAGALPLSMEACY